MPETIWKYLYSWLGNKYGTAGLMGNLYAESALNPQNLQNSANNRLGLTDEQYTAKVDNGTYTNFVRDSAGYGLAQWTYWSRKQALLDYAKSKGKSIGDLAMQLDFLKKELTENYSSLVKELKSAASVLAASNAVLMQFERPADQSSTVQKTRASYGQTYFDKYGKENTMAYYLGEASHDEHGSCWYNGQAGDQTGDEVAIHKWYSYPWNVVLRPKNAELARKSANAMIDACRNNKIGYDMNQRNTAYTQWKQTKDIAKIATACECDCSSLVSLCITQSGVDVLTGRSNAPVTSTLKSILYNTGAYEILTGSLLTDPSKCKRGDVVLSEGHHVAIFLGTSTDKVESTEEKPVNDFGIKYQAHVQGKGWMDVKHDGLTAGTVGESRRMEALKVTCPEGLKVSGKAHIQGTGWVAYPEATEITLGTTGKSKRLEAVELTFTGVPEGKKVYYQAHCETYGWQDKVENGFPVGTTGMAKSIQAFKIWCC